MTTDAPERLTAPRPPTRPDRSRVAVGLVAAVVVVGVLVRLGSRSPLWLDEAISVSLARLPLHDLPEALRHDGAPPLYYLLLHGWVRGVGTSATAVRLLSALFGVAALPLAWLAGRRLAGPVAGRAALLLLASSPFAVRYSSETRMYSLLVLLTLAGVLALQAALRRPTSGRLALVAVLSGLLALTHYWSLFLLAVSGLGLLVAAVRAAEPLRGPARRCLTALCTGGLLFLPWVPSFLYQTAHTGAPWARPPGFDAVIGTVRGWAGATGLPAELLALLLLALFVVAVLGSAGDRGRLVLGPPVHRLGALLVGACLGTLVLGITVAALQPSGYALRYSAVAFPLALLAAAVGITWLPERLSTGALALAVALGLLSAVPLPLAATRTQAGEAAALLRPELAPGDVVVYCPDQLGPALSRLLPPATQQLVYPTGGSPERVDWVDYAARNAAADPVDFAQSVAGRARGAVWLVRGDTYRTYGEQCAELDSALARLRGGREQLLAPERRFGERMRLVRYP